MSNTHVVHVLSSPLARPNGIVVYINRIKSLQEEDNDFVEVMIDDADAEHLDDMPFQYTRIKSDSSYRPGTYQLESEPEPHVWLRVDTSIINTLSNALTTRQEHYENLVVYAHCALSAAACYAAGIPCIFVQHESDIFFGTRYSYMSDDWLALHREQLVASEYVASTVYPEGDRLIPDSASHDMRDFPGKRISMPYPVPTLSDAVTQIKNRASRPIVVIADDSYRKGLDRYRTWWARNGQPWTIVLNWEDTKHSDVFNHTSFPMNDGGYIRKLNFLRRARFVVVPSRAEVSSLALLEGLSVNTVAVFDENWTRTKFVRKMTVKLDYLSAEDVDNRDVSLYTELFSIMNNLSVETIRCQLPVINTSAAGTKALFASQQK